MPEDDLELRAFLFSLNEKLRRIESRLDYFEHHHLIHHHRDNLPPRHGEEEQESAVETLGRIDENVSGINTRVASLFDLSTRIAQGVGKALLGAHVDGGCVGQLEIQVEGRELYIKCLNGNCNMRRKITDLS